MLNSLKTTATAVLLCAGLAVPAYAQEQCGVFVLFSLNSAQPTPDAIAALQAFADANPTGALTVTGFTDSLGSPGANQALSERRASAVVDVLTGAGAATIVRASGGGEAARPGTSGPDDTTNRRVEVTNARCENPVVVAGPDIGPGFVAAGVGVLGLAAAAIAGSSSSTGSGSGSN